MKYVLILFAALCMLPLSACSDDKTDTLVFDELKIELNSEGNIIKPQWMKQVVDNNMFELPNGRKASGIMTFTGMFVGNTPYIQTGISYSSYSCEAFQVYRINGEKLECGSDEYNTVMANKKTAFRTLWTAPSLLK